MFEVGVEIAHTRRAMDEDRTVCGKLPRLLPLQNGLHGYCRYLLRTQTRTASSKKPFSVGRLKSMCLAEYRIATFHLLMKLSACQPNCGRRPDRKGDQLRIQKKSISMVFSLRAELRFNGNTPCSVRTARCRESRSGMFGVTRRPSAVRRLGH